MIHTNKFLPYSETFIKNHIDSFYKTNVEVTVFASEMLADGLSVMPVNAFFLKEGALGRYHDALFKLGFLTPKVKTFLKESDVSILHSHFGQNGYASLCVAKYLQIPHVTTFHGFDVTIEDLNAPSVGVLLKKFRRDIQRLQKSGTLFVAVSDFIRSKLIDLGFDEKRVITNYLGIDLEKFKLRSTAKRQMKIICIARHVEYKGHQYLIEAMVRVNTVFPEAELVIVGSGPLTDSLKELAVKCEINCLFTGRLSSDEVQAELESSMVYCQPSVAIENGHEEALALTIVEAQAMGVPAVVFDSGGMKEALIDGESGYVVNQRDTNELGNKIIDLLTDKFKWQCFSSKAREQVERRHNLTIQNEKLKRIYTTAMDEFRNIK